VSRRATGLKVGILGVAVSVVTSGCGFHGIYSLPLPGGEGTSGGKYKVTVELADALDLVPRSSVKVNAASVGTVDSVKLSGHHAVIVCAIQNKVHLPANAIARLEQTSLLGEKFVEIEPPPQGVQPEGQLHDGSVIPLSRTDTSATIEDVLGALAMLLNGGGLDQVQSIARELNRAFSGREGALRDTLVKLETFVGGLDQQKAQIIRAMQGLDDLARTVRAQESSLTSAIDQMPGALGVLADSKNQLVDMLTSLQHLGDVAVRVENSAGADMVANLKDLEPTLTRLAEVGETIPKTLELILTYPVADGVEKAFYGDYGNLHVTIDLSRKSLERNFGRNAQ
jgi:phospholipid/cholesterol/gamma-HCH transport system substrate-binding protein